MDKYNPYQQRIRACFTDAFKFFDKHKFVRTEKDIEKYVNNLAPYTDKLTVSLLVAIVSELEREYKNNTNEADYEKHIRMSLIEALRYLDSRTNNNIVGISFEIPIPSNKFMIDLLETVKQEANRKTAS